MTGLPRRSTRFGVGKEIGGAVYVHRAYVQLLGQVVEDAQSRIPPNFAFTLVKYNLKSGAVSFVVCDDFDQADEPTVGDVWLFPSSGPPRFLRKLTDPYIYHHKWLMVMDDYDGFNVARSMARSRYWLALTGIDRSRVGRLSYWQQHVAPYLPLAPRSAPTDNYGDGSTASESPSILR